jgi:Winged helix DNA-binding domain
VTSLREVALLRLVAQRIAGPPEATPADAVRRLTAMQAQDHSGVVTSVALRTAARGRAEVEAAFDAGQVVKSWPMRGTLHLVAAEDLPWLLELTAPRVVAGARARRDQLGLDPATLERARQLTVETLAGGRRLRREELFAAWEQGGLDPSRQRGYHLLAYLAQTGVVCFGPARGGEMLIVLVAEWIPHPRHLEREEALGELALRYFRGHGPATAKDLGRWAHLVAADVRVGLALARPRLAAVDVDGVEHLMDPQTPDLLAEHRAAAAGVFLLPGFDEYVLGYQDRSAAVPAEHAERIVPGGNGVFRPTVVSAGQVVGTWRHTGRGAKRTVAATPFTAFAADVAAAIPTAYAALP